MGTGQLGSERWNCQGGGGLMVAPCVAGSIQDSKEQRQSLFFGVAHSPIPFDLIMGQTKEGKKRKKKRKNEVLPEQAITIPNRVARVEAHALQLNKAKKEKVRG